MSDATTPYNSEVMLLDSEVLLILSHHLAEASRLAFQKNYNRDFRKHLERLDEFGPYLKVMADRVVTDEH